MHMTESVVFLTRDPIMIFNSGNQNPGIRQGRNWDPDKFPRSRLNSIRAENFENRLNLPEAGDFHELLSTKTSNNHHSSLIMPKQCFDRKNFNFKKSDKRFFDLQSRLSKIFPKTLMNYYSPPCPRFEKFFSLKSVKNTPNSLMCWHISQFVDNFWPSEIATQATSTKVNYYY